jgi:hypothetical protein
LTVVGYRAGRIVVKVLPGEPERELHIQSVVPLERCSRAAPTPSQLFSNIADPKARAWFQGREKARVEAITKPFVPPILEQVRYGRTGTFTGGHVVYDE